MEESSAATGLDITLKSSGPGELFEGNVALEFPRTMLSGVRGLAGVVGFDSSSKI